MKVEPNKKMV